MWIRELPKDFRELESNITELNFLYQERNIYVMDNHLAAGWCWLHELDTQREYNFFHIDQHSDMICNAPVDKLLQIKENKLLSLDEYTNLVFDVNYNGNMQKVFQWDNYIKQINYLFPNWFKKCYFATHKYIRDTNPQETKIIKIDSQPDCFQLYTNIAHWLEEEKNDQWIFNLDLDYFFNDSGMQLFTDDYIRSMAQNLKKGLNKIAILTIALSPECCGDWDYAIRIMNIVAEELELKIRL